MLSMGGGGISLRSLTNGTHWNYNYRNFLNIGADNCTYLYECGIFSPLEAQAIDLKYDDGRPAQGSLLSKRTLCTSGTSDSDYNATYLVDVSDKVCYLEFLLGY